MVGNRHINVGIVNLDVKSNPDNPAQRAVFATILNASTKRATIPRRTRFRRPGGRR
jgi:hypothetical protein